MKIGAAELTWLGHASFKVKAEKTIYIDPFGISDNEKADLILITHGHYDHCSVEDIKKLLKEGSVVVATPDCQSKLSNSKLGIKKLGLATPGKKINANGVEFEVVPAYNKSKKFHQKAEEYVGYVISSGGKKIYHAGDTDFIPEMANLKDIDAALLPVGGTYTMDAAEAAQAAIAINPVIAIPMHYGKIVGARTDAEQFRKLLEGKIKVEILG